MADKIIIAIPARYGSQRFPGKVLAKLAGKPVIQWAWEAAVKADIAEQIIVATEDRRVLEFLQSIGAKAVMTSPKCQSGTDRVWEACKDIEADYIINFQGDEPFMTAETLKKALAKLKSRPDCQIGTACVKLSGEDVFNPNCVKIAMDAEGRALYFSRCPIPYHHPLSPLAKSYPYYLHLGFYIYRRAALEKFVSLPQSPLEKLERLEQLRALENGMRICVEEVEPLGPSIDTPEDLAAAEEYILKNR
ncbi:MAG: 3-deoxy-manno-octulosonate cytidylyltransferase [Elusimicrobiales bacterium]|nr:3-deoxy-manno-octulosonate cytidylyltransferase [Elusimicrobiales bacterium]